MLFKWFSSRPKLLGHIDVVDPFCVVGWAAYDGGVAPELTILVDRRPVGRIVPNIERVDLKPLFPDNTRLGFKFRFAVPLTKDAKISIVDQRGQRLVGSPFLFKLARTEWLDDQKRAGLAAYYLKGDGIEIGALHEPLAVPPGVSVKYVDRLSRDDLRKHYPELGDYDLIEPDIICDGESLSKIADQSVDFVIANHFIEHTQDPIATIKTFVRVLRPDGIIYMAVPDKQWSFDKDRGLTDFSHLQRDHEQGPQGSRDQHFVEWVRDVEKISKADLAKRVNELKALNYSIHFHVWDALSFLGFLSEAKLRYDIPIQLCAVVAAHDEVIVILRKVA